MILDQNSLEGEEGQQFLIVGDNGEQQLVQVSKLSVRYFSLSISTTVGTRRRGMHMYPLSHQKAR